MNNLQRDFPKLRELIDAIIADSFWFVIIYFRYHNKIINLPKRENIQLSSNKENQQFPSENEKIKYLESLKTLTYLLLKKLSVDFFSFFIMICEESDKDPLLKKDHIFKVSFIYNTS